MERLSAIFETSDVWGNTKRMKRYKDCSVCRKQNVSLNMAIAGSPLSCPPYIFIYVYIGLCIHTDIQGRARHLYDFRKSSFLFLSAVVCAVPSFSYLSPFILFYVFFALLVSAPLFHDDEFRAENLLAIKQSRDERERSLAPLDQRGKWMEDVLALDTTD